MNWIFRTFSSSVGKKQLQAVTGLLFLLFLATHLLGNLSIYGGRAAFVAYAQHLHALGKLLAGGGSGAGRGFNHSCESGDNPVLPESRRPAGQVHHG